MLRELNINEMEMVSGGWTDADTIHGINIGTQDELHDEIDNFLNEFSSATMPNGNPSIEVPSGSIVRDANGNIVQPSASGNGIDVYTGRDGNYAFSDDDIPDNLQGGSITTPDGTPYEIPPIMPCC